MEYLINLSFDENYNQVVVSSLQIAEDFKKEHKTVLRNIENFVAQNCAAKSLFHETAYDNERIIGLTRDLHNALENQDYRAFSKNLENGFKEGTDFNPLKIE